MANENLSGIAINVRMEDTILMADFVCFPTDDGKTEYRWRVLLVDQYSGKTWQGTWTQEQMSAILALGVGSVGEEKYNGYWIDHLYCVARQALTDCPPECSPIP